jgi:hypothetical protein
MKYTKIPENAFKELQLNAGVLLTDFDTTDGMTEQELLGVMIGATSGGVNFTATPTYEDYGADIDNAPTNVKELKKLTGWEVKMSGNFITVTPSSAVLMAGAADADKADTTKITPRNDVADTDFKDIWWVGDYSDKNGATNGGFVAIHMLNSLSTGGFQLQSTNKGKGQFAFEFTGHYSIADQNKVPYEVFVKAGTAEAGA